MVSIGTPAPGATVSSSIALTATASDNVGVQGVQFQVDGVNVGPPVPAPPYTMMWNSASVEDGVHTIRALASDVDGNAAAASVDVTVDNAPKPQTVGQWGASFDVGAVAVNMVMLHTGRVLMYAGSFASSWVERVWD